MNDGDKSLVCADHTLVSVAKRNTENIFPLYYEMAKADATIITKQAMYSGMITAYTGGNIGKISNDITKIWNNPLWYEGTNEEKKDALTAIKWLCMENNFVIDYAKTLYKPTRPEHVDKFIRRLTRFKVPHFFINAKDVAKTNVQPINKSTVNRIRKLIPRRRLRFDYSKIGEIDYRVLMHNQNVKLDEWGEAVVKKYNELCKHVNLFRYVDSSYDNYTHIFASIRKQMIDAFCDEQYIVDVLIKELYVNRPNSKKVVFWNVFGDIVVQNILINTRWTLICKNCGNRYYVEEEDNGLCNLCRQQ